MSSKTIFALIIFTLSTSLSFAGIGFDGALGYPSATITNPDESKATYSGVSVAGRFVAPLIETAGFDMTFDLCGRYVDLSNTANSAAQRETGNHIGLGAGLTLRLGKLYFGADYLHMRARHFFVGNKDEYLEYEYEPVNFFGGIKFAVGKSLSVAATYSHASASIPAKYTGLSDDSKYTDNIYWLHLTYETGLPFGQFFIDLFK